MATANKISRAHDTAQKNNRSNAINEVVSRYTSAGWNVIVPPQGNINDIIAQKCKKIHFIQVIYKETENDIKYTGIAKNTFIQNAFSNAAVPVHAYVTFHKRRTARGSVLTLVYANVTLEDVNLNSGIIIRNKVDKAAALSKNSDNVSADAS